MLTSDLSYISLNDKSSADGDLVYRSHLNINPSELDIASESDLYDFIDKPSDMQLCIENIQDGLREFANKQMSIQEETLSKLLQGCKDNTRM